MFRATKLRIYPTPDQAELLEKQFGAVRFAYNKALHIRSHWYRCHGVSLNNAQHIQPLLPVAKKSRRYSWLKQADSNALQVSLQNLDRAFRNFFEKRANYPKFKRKHGPQSSYHCSSLKITADTIKIPKIPAIWSTPTAAYAVTARRCPVRSRGVQTAVRPASGLQHNTNG